jgi:hypothetical protein
VTESPAIATRSGAFSQPIGVTVPAILLSAADRLLDSTRFSSEGYWAFCRFESDEIVAARFGFQRGGFNGGSREWTPNPSYLQLHLEVMTREGAVLWLPSGMYPAEQVVSAPQEFDIRLKNHGTALFEYSGWPTIHCQFRSDDRYLELELRFDLRTVTVLPDSILPHCVFAMFESMGTVEGCIRRAGEVVAVSGKAFVDHTRIIRQRNAVTPRRMSLYTTMYFEDGSGIYGYQTLDENDRPVEDYCFGVYLNPQGHGRLLTHSTLSHLVLDQDKIAAGWQLHYRGDDFSMDAELTVQRHEIIKCWGSPSAPQQRSQFSIVPLVLDGVAQIVGPGGKMKSLRGIGLAEYHDTALWPIDSKASLSGA